MVHARYSCSQHAAFARITLLNSPEGTHFTWRLALIIANEVPFSLKPCSWETRVHVSPENQPITADGVHT